MLTKREQKERRDMEEEKKVSTLERSENQINLSVSDGEHMTVCKQSKDGIVITSEDLKNQK
jgi:hypothetical protein